MKMSKESYNLILDTFSEHLEAIKEHKQWIIENASYNNLNVRLGFDAFHGLLPLNQRRHIAKSDNLKDSHLQTGILKALNELGI